ncbi:dnaJ homolog subfamily C member 13-like isoform X1 [Babylonia areolata]|uniref:dnaJ homolog subfamily C member 13-like isoform X1 n=1 Tax=Babylonia areolata TaxID=304850 RepID=UPI003FD3A918
MAALKENRDVACYFITKHSWKGKYKRIFSVGTHGITTYNPASMEITNQWPYNEFVSIVPNVRAPANNEFSITMKKGGKKTDTMKFSTDHRADLLTEALKFRNYFADTSQAARRFNAYKYHWSDNRMPVILEVNQGSLDQIDPSSNRVLCSYNYKDIEGLTQVSDVPGGVAVIHGGFGRLHLFALEAHSDLVKAVMEAAAAYVGIAVRQRKEPITYEQFQTNRLGKYSTDEALTSYAEFTVQKISVRHPDTVRRTLCLTEMCLVERDPATYNVVTAKPFCDIFSINRDPENPQKFTVEYVKGAIRTYLSTDRDSLIASILDGVRASGNRDVCVKMSPTYRGFRLGPFTVPVDEEVEAQHMKFIQAPPPGMMSEEAVNRFNANISYSGLLHAVTADGLFAQNKEKLINLTLASLIEQDGDQASVSNLALEAQFHALRRLVASKAGFQAFTELPRMREKVGLKVVKALKRNDVGVTHAALDMLCALMQPMHDNYDLRQEQLNKTSLMSSRKFLEALIEMFNQHVVHESGALVIAAMLDFLTFALCAPYSETTDGTQFDMLLEMVAANGRIIFKLFQHPSMAIVKGAGMVMKAIIEEGDAEIAAKMQDLALAEGALPRHLHTAMFTQSTDSRMLTNRQLSRHLVGLWVTGHPTAMGLLKRILPSGLLAYLDSPDDVPVSETDRLHVRDNVKLAQDHLNKNKRNLQLLLIEKKIDNILQHWRSRIGLEKKQMQNDKPIVLRKRRQRIKSEANWPLFYYYFNRDHAKPNLLWNYKTREELREAFENEMRAFNVDKELGSNCIVAWNHQEFEVPYHCLSEEIKIGDYYLRLLLEEDEESEETSAIKKSYEFFNDLYHRFLLTPKIPMKCMCLQAMAIVYGRCHEEIGAFNDTRYIVGMLERCTDKLERDRLIGFLNKLILHKRNVKEIMDANGIKVLVDLLTLAHLHTSRATVPLQTNVIEASPDMQRSSEKEWYFGNAEKERLGPYSFEEIKEFWEQGVIHSKTRCWAQGMDGWRPLHTVPQLKWTLMASGQAVMNESDLATLILNMLIRMAEYYPSKDVDGAVVRPLPRVKRILSDATCLPHIVQLLLTFDPVLVEKVATLLYQVMENNPGLSRLYLSGVFFFIMMYTGSNVLPVARFLKYTHLQQAFRSDENKTSDIMIRSVMGHIMPEAMVCYLENYSPDKFAEIFLGEFDTPEAIWNSEMRRMMIEKIASHLADFSPRLQSNTRALYQYCPIPAINYPQLENELFCNIYYLKHLCDTTRFPDWPIKDPVRLLKDILDAWKKEVEKKPPSMSVEDAYNVLNLSKNTGGHDESKIRKAYFKLAQKYHPDKNPEGREMFEQVNKAYEFLCSKSKVKDGPDPQNIVLILKAQSILFSRHKEDLHPYKYAGYPMLIKTIQMETNDDQLFSKTAPLLAAAAEVAYHTVNCSALNAEELRRENGIKVLHDAFTRCVSVLSQSSNPNDLAVQVCLNVSKCYAVAAQFEGCREKIQECSGIIRDLCRILYFKNLAKLCTVVTECVSAFCVDFWLQTNLFESGVLWHLLPNLFHYDFTLDEGGVEKSEESNQQEVANQLAKQSIFACARLAGYHDKEAGEEGPPDNPSVKKSLMAMLTPYLARKLANPEPSELLKVLNSNTENPYLIWDNATRAQLNEFLADNQQKMIRSGDCDPHFGADFEFEVHSKELIVGEIFVRIYNEQPTFPLENAKGFTIDLLDFLGSQAQYLHSMMMLQQQGQPTSSDQTVRLTKIEMALEGLRNVIKNNPGVEIQCIGHFKLLFALLRLENCGRMQQFTLEVLNCVTVNQECVKDIAAAEVLGYLLFALYSVQQCQLLTLETLFALMSNTKIVKEALVKGALIYLLDLFCNATNPGVREKTAELLAKMLADKLVGPKVRIILTKFLPSIFMDAMRDSSEASVHMFEGCHENPELIWNDEAREKVCDTVKKLRKSHFQLQRENTESKWSFKEDHAVVYGDVQGELVVGGVFLRLFIANPGWVLRKPKEFLTELLEKWSQITSTTNPDGEMLETVTTALVCLCSTQQSLLDYLPQLGYINRVFSVMSAQNNAIPKAAIQLAHQFASNEQCVRSMATFDCIGPLKMGMKARRDMIALAAEMLAKMFDKGEEDLVQQALKADLVPFLLRLLEGGLEAVENPAATKAQIVKALKAMQRSLQCGEQVSQILDKSPVWKEYKDQRHDLFITDTNIAGYLTEFAANTGPTGPSVAGYLTAGSMRSTMPDAPPPLDPDAHHD